MSSVLHQFWMIVVDVLYVMSISSLKLQKENIDMTSKFEIVVHLPKEQCICPRFWNVVVWILGNRWQRWDIHRHSSLFKQIPLDKTSRDEIVGHDDGNFNIIKPNGMIVHINGSLKTCICNIMGWLNEKLSYFKPL